LISPGKGEDTSGKKKRGKGFGKGSANPKGLRVKKGEVGDGSGERERKCTQRRRLNG